ncbi:GNAT family N-acetyltransferase [Desertihabitans brevis]|uniref:GNAT family N-acetyltransferase n=1 Tax=Desertihabitans brevis TaxID=2268447 RepID=A0A367YWQ0_9ACTN|nr:GNAT family N-acetyltransferase [Desertihabitans brevis]RCK69432.1 GNAT family N-acetyltransferase [Desertihabitans brevis]
MVVRHRRPEPGAEPPLSDALGDLVEVSEGVLVVRTRRGDVTVSRDAVVAVKEVPPPPSVPFDPLAADIAALQRLADASWPAPDRAALGDWTLRAAGGWTRRANSVLAVGAPGRGWRAALELCRGWYAERGLPLLLQVPEDDTSALLEPALRGCGLVPSGATDVLVGDLSQMDLSAAAEAEWASGPDPDWLATYRHQRDPGTAGPSVLAAPGAELGSLGPGRGEDGGIVRLWTSPDSGTTRWAVLSCLWVSPRHRGEGLGTALTLAAARRAAEHGARGLLLQVLPGNDPATALYARLGLRRHHRYAYWGRSEPQA